LFQPSICDDLIEITLKQIFAQDVYVYVILKYFQN